MSYTKKHEDFEGQLEMFKRRGMRVNSSENGIKKLSNISYYKIKEFARPYSKEIFIDGKKELIYENISFEQIITRFYQDKNLRIYLLHAIEKIELSFKTRFAYLLGEKYGPFGYLEFNNWCNKKKYCKYYLNDQEKIFKRNLQNIISRDDNKMLSEFFKENKKLKYPPIWIVTEILTFGEILKLYELMSVTNRTAIASFYGAHTPEFVSWLKNLKLLRNMSAHNSNVLDIKLKSVPYIRDEWKKYLYTFNNRNGDELITDRIGRSIIVLKYLVEEINPGYGLGNIYTAFLKIVKRSDDAAQKLGFKNSKVIEFLVKEKINPKH